MNATHNGGSLAHEGTKREPLAFNRNFEIRQLPIL